MKPPLRIGFLILLLMQSLAADTRAEFLARATSPADLGLELRDGRDLPPETFFRSSEPGRARLPIFGKPEARFPIVEVEINGNAVLALLDTGAATSVMGLDAAHRLGLIPIGTPPFRFRGTGFGGDADFVIALAEEIHFGDLPLSKIPVAVSDAAGSMAVFPRVGDRPVELLLGFDLLRSFAWIDFAQSEGFVEFSTAEDREETPGIRVPYTHRPGHGPQITARMRRDFPVVLDTGGYFGLRVPPRIAEENGIAPMLMMPIQERRSISGQSATLRAGRHSLSLGGLELQQLPVDIHHGDPEVAERMGALVGNPVLSRVRWILDTRKQEIVFVLP